MKKVFAILAIATVFASCGSNSTTTNTSDSTSVATDSTVVKADSTVTVDTTSAPVVK